MQGIETVSAREANIALLSVIPESEQKKIYVYLTSNYCGGNPFKPLSAEEIYAELEESRECYARGEYEDFDDALEEISTKYGI